MEQLRLTQINMSTNPIRTDYGTTGISNLMGSMNSVGLLHPIVVRPNGKKNKFEIVAGHRRFVAAQKLGWKKISVKIDDFGDTDAVVARVAENVCREDVNLASIGAAIINLIDEGLTQEEIAIRIGVSKTTVRDALNLFKVIPKEFHKKISRTVPQGRRTDNGLSFKTANSVIFCGKAHLLKGNNMKRLATLSLGVATAKINTIASAIADGKTDAEIKRRINNLASSSIKVTIDLKQRERFEKKFNVKFNDFVKTLIAESDAYKVLA